MKSKYILALGDTVTLLIVTLIGFATHGETGISFLPRLLATFIPLCLSWFLLAPRFGLFTHTQPPPNSRIWGRCPAGTVGVAMLFTAPFAATLRGLILNAPILPIFAVVLGVTSALGMMVWRAIYFFIARP